MTLSVSDHALLQYLERTGLVDVEAVRADLQASLERASGFAEKVGNARQYTVHVAGLFFLVRDDVVTKTIQARRKGRG